MCFFSLEWSDLNFDGSFIFICRITIALLTNVLDRLVCFLPKYYHITGPQLSTVNRARMQSFRSSSTFFQSGFFQTDTDDSQYSREGRRLISFFSAISTYSQISTHLFAVLHFRWLPFFPIFHQSACNYYILTGSLNLNGWILI